MSARCLVRANDLSSCFHDINPLIPKGAKDMAVLFELKGSTLTIAHTTGCVYKSELAVSNPENSIETAIVMYKNLSDFIPNNGEIDIEIEAFGITLSDEDFTIQLPRGYSEIHLPDFPDVSYTTIETNTFTQGLLDLLNLGLANLYSVDKPIHVYGDISVLKYPNMQAQARTQGLPFKGLITPEHAKLLARFHPQEFYTDGTETLYMRKQGAYLVLPIQPLIEDNNFLNLMSRVDNPVTLSFDKYVDQVRSMAKLGKKLVCTITIYSDGILTKASADNVSIEAKTNVIGGEVLKVVQLPIDLWLALLKVVGNGKAQILYGEDCICLRTYSIILLVRALI